MNGVSLRDRVSSTNVAQRCGLEELLEVTRVRIWRWFGHVKRREEGKPYREYTIGKWKDVVHAEDPINRG